MHVLYGVLYYGSLGFVWHYPGEPVPER